MTTIPAKRNKTATLRRKLFFSMLLLALILTAIVAIGLLGFGMLDDPTTSTASTLGLQLDFFEDDMKSSWSQLTVMGIDLSEDVSSVLDAYVEESGETETSGGTEVSGESDQQDESDRSERSERMETSGNDPALQGEVQEVESLLLPLLTERVKRVPCSGGFILLSTQDNARNEAGAGEGIRYPGLYVIREDPSDADGRLLLFRGLYSVARENGMNLHAKWRQDFETSRFPGYDNLIAKAAAVLPLEQSYHISGPTELAGTDEQVFYLSVPLVGEDRQVYGLCGFEVSRRFFRSQYGQPTRQQHLICLFTHGGDDVKTLDADMSFSCGVNYVTPQGSFSVREIGGGLLELRGISDDNDGVSYIGVQKTIAVSYGDPDYVLTAMIPKADYDAGLQRYYLQNILLLILMVLLAVIFCLYFSRRFVKPVLASLKRMKEEDFGNAAFNITELDELDSFLQERQQEHRETVQAQEETIGALKKDKESAEQEASRLAYSRKKEIDPLLYEHFVKGLATLTPTEKQVLVLYVAGMGTKEVCGQLGVKESTLRFHNKNIYSKLGVNSRKQLVLYAAVALKERKEKPE